MLNRYSITLTILIVIVALASCTIPAPQSVDIGVNYGEPTATVAGPTPTAGPTATTGTTPTALPLPTNQVRVSFDRGTWGKTVTGSGATAYLLRAAKDQIFLVEPKSEGLSLDLRGPGDVVLSPRKCGKVTRWTLLADGDQILIVRGTGDHEVIVEIRNNDGTDAVLTSYDPGDCEAQS